MRLIIASLALILTGLFSTFADAQESLPAGKWWKRPAVVRQLGLTADQQDRLDSVFLRHANVLIDLRAEIDKRSLALRSELDRAQLDRQSIANLAQQIGDSRSRLFQQELLMLVDMRAVLTTEQWTRVRRVLNARESEPQRPNPRRR